MLKPRIIATLNLKREIVVQSISFTKYFPIGSPQVAVEFLNAWGVDEIVLLDLFATAQKRSFSLPLLRFVASKCFVPLTVGGGIQSVQDMRELLRNGADKICVNAAALHTPLLITEAAAALGSQCIIVSIDTRQENDKYLVYSRDHPEQQARLVVDWAKQVEQLGAGEILLNSTAHDGQKQGYDLRLLQLVCQTVTLPVIACGGVGSPKHLLEGIQAGANAVAAGNFFHFTEHSVITAKEYLRQAGVDVRCDTRATYKNASFDSTQRISKQTDTLLEHQRFEYIQEEVI